MMSQLRHWLSPRNLAAQALIEFALVTPILLGLIVVVVQLGLLYFDYLSVGTLTRDTTRWIATNPLKTDDEVKAYVQQVTSGTSLVYSEFVFNPGWLSPSCATAQDCSDARKAGETQTVTLTYQPTHHVFLRGLLSLGFFSAQGPYTLPMYSYSMMISHKALPPDATTTPTSTAPPATPSVTPTVGPGTPTSTPVVTATLTPTPIPQLAGYGMSFSVQEGTDFNGSVATFSAQNGSSLSATITWGDTNQMTTGTIQSDGSGKYHVTGEHIFKEAGVWNVLVSISDGTYTVMPVSTATVSDAPVTAQGVNINAVAKVLFSGTLATFTDANPYGQASDFGSSYIDWGDNSATWADRIQQSGSVFSLVGSHTYAAAGTYTVTETIVDVGGATKSVTSTATVVGPVALTAAKEIDMVEGQASPTTMATFTALDQGPFTGTVNWGDGRSSPADGTAVTIASDGQGGYLVTGQHAYAEFGTYSVTINVTDQPDGYTATATTSAVVKDAPISVTATSITATAGTLFNGQVGTFSDTNPAGNRNDITITLSWGDGSQTAGSLGANGVISGSHTYAVTGNTVATYTLTVTAVDVGGARASATSTVTVNPPPMSLSAGSAINAFEGQQFTSTVATLSLLPSGADAGLPASNFTATLNWGDNSTSAGSLSATGANTFSVNGTHVYAEETCSWNYQTNSRSSCWASMPVSVTVTDRSGNTVSTSLSAFVDDAPFSVPTTTFTVLAGEAFALPIFTDGNPNAQLSDYYGAGWSYTPDPGTRCPQQVPGWPALTGCYLSGQTYGVSYLQRDPNRPGGFLLESGSYTYQAAGSYPLLVGVMDNGGQLLSQSYTVNVVDQRPIGFVGSSVGGITIQAEEGFPWSGQVARFSASSDPTLTASQLAATITWYDNNSGTYATTTGSVSGNAQSGFVVSGGHTFPYPGQWSASVTLTDASAGWSIIGSTPATVSAAPLHGIGLTFNAVATVTFNGTVARFTDDNAAAPVWEFSPQSTSIDWGDGQTSKATSITSDAGGGYDVVGSHVYGSNGTYPVHVSIQGSYGNATDAYSTANVSAAPTPTPTPLPTSTPTLTPTPRPTSTPTNTPVVTNTPVPTNTPTLPPTATPTPRPPTSTPTPMPTSTSPTTPAATPTSTPAPTNTSVPPTDTPTPRPYPTPIPTGVAG